jgi:hypothetical protein
MIFIKFRKQSLSCTLLKSQRRRKDNPNEISTIFSNYLESKRKSFFHPHPNFSFARKNDFGVRLPD